MGGAAQAGQAVRCAADPAACPARRGSAAPSGKGQERTAGVGDGGDTGQSVLGSACSKTPQPSQPPEIRRGLISVAGGAAQGCAARSSGRGGPSTSACRRPPCAKSSKRPPKRCHQSIRCCRQPTWKLPLADDGSRDEPAPSAQQTRGGGPPARSARPPAHQPVIRPASNATAGWPRAAL